MGLSCSSERTFAKKRDDDGIGFGFGSWLYLLFLWHFLFDYSLIHIDDNDDSDDDDVNDVHMVNTQRRQHPRLLYHGDTFYANWFAPPSSSI